jgi:uncharacterized protein (DUF4415 family)
MRRAVGFDETRIRLHQGQTSRGVLPEPGKTRITIRLYNEILDHFHKRVHQMGGGNYQTLINEALREYIRRGGIRAAVRRAVREELRAAGVKQTAGG